MALGSVIVELPIWMFTELAGCVPSMVVTSLHCRTITASFWIFLKERTRTDCEKMLVAVPDCRRFDGRDHCMTEWNMKDSFHMNMYVIYLLVYCFCSCIISLMNKEVAAYVRSLYCPYHQLRDTTLLDCCDPAHTQRWFGAAHPLGGAHWPKPAGLSVLQILLHPSGRI